MNSEQMTDERVLAVMAAASKRLRIPGVPGIAAGPVTAEQLDAAAAYLANRFREQPASTAGVEGMVQVPREPTKKMKKWGDEIIAIDGKRVLAESIYDAMLAAAPKPEDV